MRVTLTAAFREDCSPNEARAASSEVRTAPITCVEGPVVVNGREILPNPHMERGRPSDALNLRTPAVGRRRQLRCRRAAPEPDWSSYTIAIVVEGTPTRRLSIRKDHSKARGFASSSFPPPAN